MSQDSSQGNVTSIGGRWLWFDLGGDEIKIVPLAVFPRRGQSVILRLFDDKGNGPIAEFTAANPTPGPHPVWTPVPLPITKQEGALAFALTELKSRSNFRGGSAAPGEVAVTHASFRITEKGSPTKAWAPVQVTISDATGNTISEEIHSPLNEKYNYKNDEVMIQFQKMLCVEEAWKLRVEFSRTGHARFAADELWTVRGVPLPGLNTIIRSTETATRQGRTLRLVGIGGGPGNLEWTPERSSGGDWRAQVKARLSLPCDGLRVSLFATDDRGRKFTGSVIGYADIGEDNEREFTFTFYNIPPDVSTLDLTFAVHGSHYAEYLTKPSVP